MMGSANPVIAKAMTEFPRTFALRAMPNRIFRISDTHSYIDDAGNVQLYTEILSEKELATGGVWHSYAKATPSELAAQIVPVTNKAWHDAHSGQAAIKPAQQAADEYRASQIHHKLGDFRASVLESLNNAIALYVEDTDYLPSPEEYAEMAYHALSTSALRR